MVLTVLAKARTSWMQLNFHESYAGSEVRPPSERSTGLLFAAVAAAVAFLRRDSLTVVWVSLSLAAALALVSLIRPTLLKPVNALWFRLGLVLHRVVSPLVMFALFAVVFVPAGAVMRLWHDPLRLKRSTGGSSYWIDRTVSEDVQGSMTNQF
jgi:hypothetical protein